MTTLPVIQIADKPCLHMSLRLDRLFSIHIQEFGDMDKAGIGYDGIAQAAKLTVTLFESPRGVERNLQNFQAETTFIISRTALDSVRNQVAKLAKDRLVLCLKHGLLDETCYNANAIAGAVVHEQEASPDHAGDSPRYGLTLYTTRRMPYHEEFRQLRDREAADRLSRYLGEFFSGE